MSDENKTPLSGELPADLTEEEIRRIQKYSKIEQSKAKRTAIVVSVTAFLIILFVGGVVGGLIYLSGYEAPQALPSEYYAPLPGKPDEIYDVLMSLLPNTEDTKSVKLSVNTSIGISDKFTVASGREYLQNEIKFIRESVEKRISEYDTNYNSSFGDDFTSRLPQLDFDATRAVAVTCADEADKDNANKIWRNFTFDFAGGDFEEVLEDKSLAVFELPEAKEVFLKYADSLTEMLTVTGSSIHCDTLRISANADSYTGMLDSITLKRAYTVTAEVTFAGKYAAVGSDTFTFNAESCERYSFTYAGVNISKDEIFTEKGKSDEIIRTVSTDEPHNDAKIKWTSSNPEVLSVDEKGYFKAKKISEEPVTVTAEYTYLGITYSDTCTVYVREPVKSVKVSQQKLTLAPREKATLGAALKPADATITTVYWFSEDESVAVINKETGEVTAVSPGEVKVYCITHDGNFKDSCELTVTN